MTRNNRKWLTGLVYTVYCDFAMFGHLKSLCESALFGRTCRNPNIAPRRP